MKLGLIGKNISYSLSKHIHTTSARNLGLDLSYEVYDLATAADVAQCLESFWQEGGHGLNITTPYKEIVATLTNNPAGSVNTLFRGKHYWESTSTDGKGFEEALRQGSVDLQHVKDIIFIGAGGATRAIISHLVQQEWFAANIHILRRSSRHDQSLSQISSVHRTLFYDVSLASLNASIKSCTQPPLLVQATNAPQHGHDLAELTPALKDIAYCMDLNYGSAVSSFVAYCKLHAIPVQDGTAMLVEQALAAQRIWWGQSSHPGDKLPD